MKIGLFTDTYFPQINGVATSVHTLAEALEEKGHRVYIFTPSDPRCDKEENPAIIRMPSIPFLLLKNFRVGTVYSPIALNKISHLQLDIVHTQTEFSLGMFGKFLSVTHNIPMVHTYHTMYEDYVHYVGHGYLATPAMAKEFSRLFCNAAKAVVAPTQKAKNSLEEYGVKKPIHIIPTGIDTRLFAKSNFKEEETILLKQSLGLQEDTPVILSLGRIAKEKSIDVIIKAMPAVLKQLPDARLLIIGDGPERENLSRLSHSLGVADSVLFAGSRPWNEIGRYYQLGTVFVSASLSETQGLTFAEAMAGGIPVIAKRDDSIAGMVQHGITGLLFEQDQELAEKLLTLLCDSQLREAYSDAAMEKMKELSVSLFADRMETLYEQIANSAPSKIPLVALPVVMGARAVKKITHIPSRIIKKGLHTSGTAIGRLPTLHFFHGDKKALLEWEEEPDDMEYTPEKEDAKE